MPKSTGVDVRLNILTNGRGFRCDILNDAVGVFLVAWGVFALAEIRVDERYRQAMTFVKIMSVRVVDYCPPEP